MNHSASILIPACGDGTRFGDDTPKHLVQIEGKPMVQRVIDELPSNVPIYVLVRPHYLDKTRMMVQGASVVPVSSYSRGVCETLLAAPVDYRTKVLVINCDNVIAPSVGWHQFLSQYDNAIVTFWEEDPTIEPPPYSYVKVRAGHIIAVAEKKRLSRYACAGAFLFQDYETLRLLCKWHLSYDPPDAKNEHYLAPVYSRLIDDPATHVRCVHLIGDDLFIRMGTPSEANEARKHYVSRD